MENFEVTIVSSKSVQLSWKPPKRKYWNGVIDHYSITVLEQNNNGIAGRAPRNISVPPQSNNPDPSLATEPLQAETYHLEGLEENFDYSISISAVNAAGSSLASNPLQQKMPQAGKIENLFIIIIIYNIVAPSGPPINISVQSVTLTSINITWKPPNPYDANGIITGYQAIFTRAEINDVVEYSLPSYNNYLYKNGMILSCMKSMFHAS